MHNILYLHEASALSGAENSLFSLAFAIDKANFFPLFACPDKGKFPDKLKSCGIEVVPVTFPRVRDIRGVASAVSKIHRIATSRSISLLHSNSIRTHIYASIVGKITHLPVIWHERNMLERERYDPDRLLSFLPDRIVCNSAAVAQRFLHNGRMPAHVSVIYNGVDTRRFTPIADPRKVRAEFNIGPEEIVIGIASRFNKIKGHEIFFQAARRVCEAARRVRRSVRFLVVGNAVFKEDVAREKELQAMVRELALDKETIFTGFRDDMPDIYAAIDIFVLSTTAEACGRVILEAMASGKPVIGTASGGTPELVVDTKTGFLFPPQDAAALTDKIDRLVNDPALAKQMGRSGRARVEESFSIEMNVARTEALYRDILEGKRLNVSQA